MYSTSLVWTGAPSAMVAGTSQDTCNSWTATGGNGLVGGTEYAIASTTFTELTYGCSNALRVYCIEE